MTVSIQVCTHGLIPEGGLQQTLGQGYNLFYLGGALNSTLQLKTAYKQTYHLSDNDPAATQDMFGIFRPIMKHYLH